MERSIYFLPTLIGYLVHQLHARDPNKRILLWRIQQLMYLYSEEFSMRIPYGISMSGVSSSTTGGSAAHAGDSNILNLVWTSRVGWVLTPNETLDKYMYHLTPDDRSHIDWLVEEYAHFDLKDLSEIAREWYIHREFTPEATNDGCDVRSTRKIQSDVTTTGSC